MLINIVDFQGRADLTVNLDSLKVISYIDITEKKFLRAIVGRELFGLLETEQSQRITDLLNYVKDFLVYKTYARALVSMNVTSTAAGMRVSIDTISQSPDAETMRVIRKQADSDANYYQDELVKYLNDNRDTYPEYSRANFVTLDNNIGRVKKVTSPKLNWT